MITQENQPVTSAAPTLKILHRWSRRVMFEAAAESFRALVLLAISQDADLTGADLTGADLTGADLTGADLTDADLTDADLARANLVTAKEDIFRVLSQWPAEVPGLLAEVKAGRINGSCYSGKCSCLKGTIARLHGTNVYKTPGLELDGSSPAENWFMGISPGHLPSISKVAAITVGWIEEWQAANNPVPNVP